MCLMLYMFYLYIQPRNRNLNLTVKSSKGVLRKAKVVNTTDMLNVIPNLLQIFFVSDTVTNKPQNLYLVQLYQNTGDYLYDNVAAVTVSLHHPLYAMVSDLPPSFY